MTITKMMGSALVLSLVGTGCATKKYVAKAIAPVEARVSATETKNTDQDKQLATHTTQIDELDKDLSRTKEKLAEVDRNAVAAVTAARTAEGKADQANQAAGNAASAAENARTSAANGISQLSRTVDGLNNYRLLKSESVMFTVNKATLSADAKAKLDGLSESIGGIDRYVVEVQGFTDKTGSPGHNDELSGRRAEAVARYLANNHKIPVRIINLLGLGYASPVADDGTLEGRKQNRRVEIHLYVPEVTSATGATAKAGGQQ